MRGETFKKINNFDVTQDTQDTFRYSIIGDVYQFIAN